MGHVGGEVYIVILILLKSRNQGDGRGTGLGGQVGAPRPGSWGRIVVGGDGGNEWVVIDREGPDISLHRWVRKRDPGG
jgi:hypothetical protein